MVRPRPAGVSDDPGAVSVLALPLRRRSRSLASASWCRAA
ncbi:hypothetical protein H4W32_002809 [Actinophytocola algeriensis]|nr:hypothetical protein [Actinophytocola algeriensis]